ncbi:hypothetical protein J8L84_18085 [Alteromonas sp. MMG017]|nr:hypothetical protein [Alteromonas sp. MMG017]
MLAASKEAFEVTLEKYTNKSTLNKTNFINFAFIFLVVICLSFVAFDLNKDDERSFVFSLLFIMWIAYGAGSNKVSAFEFRETTDYTPSASFAGICLCWWVALTDYFLVLDQTSRFSGFFLAFSLLLTFGLMLDFIHYFSDKIGKPITPWYIIRIGQIILVGTLGALLYFLVYGNWNFHIGGPFEFLSRVMRGY